MREGKVNSKVLVSTLRTPVVVGTVTRVKRLLRLKTLGFGHPDLPMSEEVRSCLTSEFAEEIGLLEELPRRDPTIWRRAPHEGSA